MKTIFYLCRVEEVFNVLSVNKIKFKQWQEGSGKKFARKIRRTVALEAMLPEGSSTKMDFPMSKGEE